METVLPMQRADGWIVVDAGPEVPPGDTVVAVVGENMMAVRVVTVDPGLLQGRAAGTHGLG